MPKTRKNAVIYKGYLDFSHENSPDGNPHPALSVSSFYLAEDESFKTKYLTGLEEVPDIRLEEGHILYVISEARQQSNSQNGRTEATESLCQLLEVFREKGKALTADTTGYVFHHKIKPEHSPQLGIFCENKVEALLYCPARPGYHRQTPTLAHQE